MSRINDQEQFYKILPVFLNTQCDVEFTADDVLRYLKKNHVRKYVSPFKVRNWLHKTNQVKKIGRILVPNPTIGKQYVNLYMRNKG